MKQLDLGHAPLISQPTLPFRILALSGGGYRGIFSSALLAKTESLLGDVRLRDRVDLIAGTSVGGLLAIGLALGIPAIELHNRLKEHGPAIFDQRLTWAGCRVPLLSKKYLPAIVRGLFASRYTAGPLEKAIVGIVGGDRAIETLNNLDQPLLVTAVSAISGKPVLIVSKGLGGVEQPASFLTILEAARATSAAPTYIPALDLPQDSLIDGGLAANAPELTALALTIAHGLADIAHCRVISIGTAAPGSGKVPHKVGNRGTASWLASGLIELTLAAQEHLAARQMKCILGARYIRLDQRPDAEQAKVVGLDAADVCATNTLEHLADEAWLAVNRAALIRWFEG